MAKECDHKFIGSKHCLKCGWMPGGEVRVIHKEALVQKLIALGQALPDDEKHALLEALQRSPDRFTRLLNLKLSGETFTDETLLQAFRSVRSDLKVMGDG